MANSSRSSVSVGEAAKRGHSNYIASEGRGMAKIEVSSGFNSGTVSLSQPLAPIGTPPLKIDAQPDYRSQTSRYLRSHKISCFQDCKESINTLFCSTGHFRQVYQLSLVEERAPGLV